MLGEAVEEIADVLSESAGLVRLGGMSNTMDPSHQEVLLQSARRYAEMARTSIFAPARQMFDGGGDVFGTYYSNRAATFARWAAHDARRAMGESL